MMRNHKREKEIWQGGHIERNEEKQEIREEVTVNSDENH